MSESTGITHIVSQSRAAELTSQVEIFSTDLTELGRFTAVGEDDLPESYASLLAHHDHMTVTLEAYWESLVAVRVVQERLEGAVYARQSLLARHSDNAIVQYGIVRIDLAGLPANVRESIEKGNCPLGRILIKNNLLRDVELLALWRIEVGDELARRLAIPAGDVIYGRSAAIHLSGERAVDLLEIAGHTVLLLEREKMPREHVGESLMPESYWAFERLGILEKLNASKFSRKVGVQFVNNTGRESQPFFFRSHDPSPSSETWHVDRAEFDKMLFDNAADKGAHARDGMRVIEILLEGNRAVGVVVVQCDGATHRITAQVVIDASGQQTLLASKLGLRRVNPELKKAAIWRHYRGADRDESGGGVKTIILHTSDKKAWFWYIPQADDLVSVGCVADNDYLLKGRGKPEQTFQEELAKCEGVQQRVAGAEAMDDLRVAKEFSYMTDQAAGDGWVLVGDAWGFIDPVYSSGVYFALQSAMLAADAVSEGLRQGDTSAAQLGKWDTEFRQATNSVRKLVHAFYSGEFRVGKFVTEHPHHHGNLTDLLIGRIFKPGVHTMFDDLDPWLEQQIAEANSSDAV
ncbi:1H-pyrrole-2-carbonyl-[peptidyl-carrier protein] chlorinase (FADH2-dependent halogenase PltA) [Durusdinium trenchii]|uniref:1H-pyrrole-2-carbonyl-[peptidyl-carrier protein] chlorinase (FADH2-dependent halogenase PltA) n=1 Tax=Durusdinium trenchii TaxID=1381693 RepID=A0ABP0LH43_9DINO